MGKKIFFDMIDKARNLYSKHLYDQATDQLSLALDYYKEKGFDFEFPRVLEDLHISNKSIENPSYYTNTLLAVIDLLEEKKQYHSMADYMMYLVGNWMQVGHADKTVQLLNRGLSLVKGKYQSLEYKFTNTLGNYYFNIGDFDRAKNFYLDVYNQNKDVDLAMAGKAAHNLGNAFKKMGDYNAAIEYLHKGESYFLTVEDESYRSNSFCDLADAYLEIKAFDLVENYLDKAYIIALELNIKSQLIDITKERMDLYTKWNKYEKAYKYQEEYYERLRLDDKRVVKYEVELAINNHDIEVLKKEIEVEGKENKKLQLLLTDLQDSKQMLQKAVNESERVQGVLLSKNEELSLAYKELIEVQEKLLRTEKNNALNRLIMKVAHELNTPLGNIILILDYFYMNLDKAMKQEQSDKRERGIVAAGESIYDNWTMLEASMHSAKEFIDTLQTSILDFNASHYHEVDLKKFINHIITETEFMYPLKCHYTIEIPDQMKWHISTKILRTVITNIIGNAYEHAFSNQRENEISIEVTFDNALVILISDNGPGIDNSLKDQIFEPFKSKMLNKKGKLGHGLFVVKSLVEDLLEGRVELLDTPSGACYRITLNA